MAVFAPSTGARRTSAKPFARSTFAAIAAALPPAAGVSVKLAIDTTATESCDVKAGMPVCRIELHAPSNSAHVASAADQPAIRDHPLVLLIEPLLSLCRLSCRIRSLCLRYLRYISVAATPPPAPDLARINKTSCSAYPPPSAAYPAATRTDARNTARDDRRRTPNPRVQR